MPFLTYFCPLSGGHVVKKYPKFTQNQHFFMFWPNNVWKPFCINCFIIFFFSLPKFKHFKMSLCHFWPSYVPFQGVMLCINGQKLLKINISCMFWPNSVWIFLMTSFYEICLVKHIFNIVLPLFPIFAPFRGSCCVKMAQKYDKSTFLAVFDPIMYASFFIASFLDILLVEHFSTFFVIRGGEPSQDVLVAFWVTPFAI